MAMLVLFNNMSFAIDIHYCFDEVWSISVLGDAEACPMGQKKDVDLVDKSKEHKCCKYKKDKPKTDSENKITKKDCCSTSHVLVESNSEIQGSENVSLDRNEFVAQVAILSVLYNFTPLVEAPNLCVEPPPPLIEKDYSVLFQVFRI